jgi:transcriptional regulator with XRE-family HTH domain
MPRDANAYAYSEPSAIRTLRAATDEAASLIRDKTPPEWFYLVPVNGRAYVVNLVPYALTTSKRRSTSEREFARLTVSDLSKTRGEGMPMCFAVLEFSTLRGKTLETGLKSNVIHGTDDAYVPATVPDLLRFWLDLYRNGLGPDLRKHLSSGDFAQLGELRGTAALAVAGAVQARRSSRRMTQSEFAELAGIPVEYVAATEEGQITIASPSLLQENLTPQTGNMSSPGAQAPPLVEIKSLLAAELAAGPSPVGLGAAQIRILRVTSASGWFRVAGYGPSPPPEPPERKPKYGPHQAAGAKIRTLREGLGINQKDFAGEAGIGRSRYNRIELGHVRITKVLQAQIDSAFVRLANAAGPALS